MVPKYTSGSFAPLSWRTYGCGRRTRRRWCRGAAREHRRTVPGPARQRVRAGLQAGVVCGRFQSVERTALRRRRGSPSNAGWPRAASGNRCEEPPRVRRWLSVAWLTGRGGRKRAARHSAPRTSFGSPCGSVGAGYGLDSRGCGWSFRTRTTLAGRIADLPGLPASIARDARPPAQAGLERRFETPLGQAGADNFCPLQGHLRRRTGTVCTVWLFAMVLGLARSL